MDGYSSSWMVRTPATRDGPGLGETGRSRVAFGLRGGGISHPPAAPSEEGPLPEPHEKPYLHVRPTYRAGEAPRAELRGNRAGLLRLSDQIDRALEEDRRAEGRYLEAEERAFVLWVSRARRRSAMGEPREPERGLLERAGLPRKAVPTRQGTGRLGHPQPKVRRRVGPGRIEGPEPMSPRPDWCYAAFFFLFTFLHRGCGISSMTHCLNPGLCGLSSSNSRISFRWAAVTTRLVSRIRLRVGVEDPQGFAPSWECPDLLSALYLRFYRLITKSKPTRYCENCEQPFEATRSNKRFCGPSCRSGIRYEPRQS
jgi:hypothetical protein